MSEIIALDLETTGLRYSEDEILEIGAYKIQDGVVKDQFHSYIKPRVHIPDFITNINGITDAMVADADPMEVVIPEFYNFCGDDSIFLGHNIKHFDIHFLQAKGRTCGVDFDNNTRLYIDTLELARTYIKKPVQIKNHKLATVIDYFDIKVSDNNDAFHTAKFDAYASWLIFQRFKILRGLDANIASRL